MAKYIVIHGIRIDKDHADFVSETFGRLTTIGPKFWLPVCNYRRAFQVCQCECGNIGVYATCNIQAGRTKSCGCFLLDFLLTKFTKHGDAGSIEHMTWQRIKSRCHNNRNKSYPDYGGRGIRVCDRWLDPVNGYANFLADMGRRPPDCNSIERKNVNGHYCPENCMWANTTQQARNKRNTRNVSGFGKTQCLMTWAEEYNIHSETLRDRLDAGMTLEEAIKHPKRKDYPKGKKQ